LIFIFQGLTSNYLSLYQALTSFLILVESIHHTKIKKRNMKKISALLLGATALLVMGCTKTDLPAQDYDPDQWMQTHQRAEVAYTDYFTGNYIVQSSQGFAVVENWGGSAPRDFDVLYAHFQFTGMQTIYNRSGNYFTKARIVDNWLTWGEAWNILDMMSNR
jgi:hypothetical protein